MAKKFSIAQAPTFESSVEIPRLGGESIKVPFTFKYLDRGALADLYSSWGERFKRLVEETREQSLEAFTTAQIDLQVEQVQAVVAGWGFDEAFTEANVRLLVSSLVSVPEAILEAYQSAYSRGRLGNGSAPHRNSIGL
ncbi:phage tail assembly chaperone [Pseudomonas aeruginosa]|uniref:phage tail assembly chaperone n=1 Tax=Pseudomonas aeruginosa TaxID=287 RepID=UPI00396971C0